MAELVDALGLGSSEVTRGGSSPLSDTMEIIDNFLSEEDYEKLNTAIVKSNFEWGKSTILTGGRFQLHKIFNIQFVHKFIKVHTESINDVLVDYKLEKSKHYNIIEPILEKINYSRIIRIKANLTVGMLDPKPSGYHIDVGEGNNVRPGFTGIYYVNTCNGYTLFQNGTKVQSVANRMVIFDNQLKHSGVSCSDNRYRIVINFNWLP